MLRTACRLAAICGLAPFSLASVSVVAAYQGAGCRLEGWNENGDFLSEESAIRVFPGDPLGAFDGAVEARNANPYGHSMARHASSVFEGSSMFTATLEASGEAEWSSPQRQVQFMASSWFIVEFDVFSEMTAVLVTDMSTEGSGQAETIVSLRHDGAVAGSGG